MKKDITELFVCIDDFTKIYETALEESTVSCGSGRSYKTRVPKLSLSELMTIILLFHRSASKNFKHFYKGYLLSYQSEFPSLCSYNRFIELIARTLHPFSLLLKLLCAQASKTGIYYIDSTAIPVCKNKRISRHKVFDGSAARGKTSMGWFFGFKLHLVINEKGELMAAQLTPGNTDDRQPVSSLVTALKGLLFGDKGYISSILFSQLYENGLKLVTSVKKNMKNTLLSLDEKIFLRKRSLIETVNGVLKQDFQLCHSRHRSVINAFVHLCSTLVAYSLKSNKPSIKYTVG